MSKPRKPDLPPLESADGLALYEAKRRRGRVSAARRPATVAVREGDSDLALTHDPRTGVTVEAFGRDRGTPERNARGDLGNVTVWDGKRSTRARGVRRTVDALEANGTITKAEHIAAVVFQESFERAGLQSIASCLGRDGPPAPFSGRDGHIGEGARYALRELDDMLEAVGGHDSRAALAVIDVCGFGLSLREHVRKRRAVEGVRGYSVDIVRGILPTALGVLARRLRLRNQR